MTQIKQPFGRKETLFSVLQANRLVVSLLILLALAVLMLWRVVFKGDILLAFDMFLAYEPWRSEVPGALAWPLWNEKAADLLRIMYPINLFIKDSWARGEVPFWYPYAGLGLPALAQGLHQALYPVNIIGWWLLGLPEAIGWLTLLHLFLAGVFTFFFARQLNIGNFGSLVAAITFSYSSPLVMWFGLPPFFNTMIWLPLIFLGLERAIVKKDWRWGLLSILGLTLQVFAGSLQLVAYGLTGLGLYAAGRCWLEWRQQRVMIHALCPLYYFGVIVLAGVGLTALQLLPTFELVSQELVRGQVALNPYIPLRTLARILIPDFIGTPLDGNDMSTLEYEVYLYLGVAPLFLVLASWFSKRAGIAWLLSGIGLLSMLVIYSVPPFYQLFYFLYPTFTSLGFHRALYVVALVWAVAGGIGADWIYAQPSTRPIKALIAVGGLVIFVVLAYLLRIVFIAKYQARFFWHIPAVPDVEPGLVYHISALVISLTLITAAILIFWLWSTSRLKPPFFVSAIIGLLVLDLFLAHLDFYPALPKYIYDSSPPSLTYLKELAAQQPEPFRISNGGLILKSNISGIYGIPTVRAHDVFLSRRFNELASLTGLRADGSSFREVTFAAATAPLFNAFNVRHIYANRQDLVAGDWVSVLQTIGLPVVASNRPGAGQLKYWNLENWTQPVLAAPTPSELTYVGQLAYPAVLETAIAVDPQTQPQSAVTFEIFASEPGTEPTQPLFSYRLEPAGNAKWIPVTVSLAEFAGKPVQLTLVTTAADGLVVWAGWADPLLYDGSKYELIYYGPNSIYRNKNVLPRAWLVHQVTEVAAENIDSALAIMRQPHFDPASMAVIEGQLPAAAAPATGSESVAFAEYGPSASTLTANLTASGLLVLSDIYYPGWTVYVDDVRQPLYATNVAMRGVYLPAGEHQVRFVYEPRSFWVGLAITLTTMIAILAAVIVDLLRRRKRAAAAGAVGNR